MRCFKQADVYFIIDSSGSICGQDHIGTSCDNWSRLLSFINSIIDAFTVGEKETRVGVVTFSTDASLTYTMDQFYENKVLKEAVSSISYIGGETSTGKALRNTRTQCFNQNNGERRGVPNTAVIITDGLPTVAKFNAFTEASLLKKTSTVLAVGITRSVEKQLLREISSPPQRENENFFTTPDFSNLNNIIEALVTETCEATLVTEPPPAVAGIRFYKTVTVTSLPT